MNRTKPYVEKGRNQTEEESDEFSKLMFNIVSKYANIDFNEKCVENKTSTKIMDCILKI